MTRNPKPLQLSREDRRSLTTLLRSGTGKNRQHTRARILDLLARKVPPAEIAPILSCALGTVYNVKRRYEHEGLEADVLSLYSLPYEAKRPVVCFDELPVQLLNDVVEELPMQAGKPARFDYEYARAGTASVLVAFEPLTGMRLVETSKQRTKADYCRFQQRVAACFPHADKIVLVQDNLNTHNTSAFYEHLPPAAAFALAQQFEFHYTPKKGSWLNIAELELSALSRLCLSRRLGSIVALDRELQALVKERNRLRIKVEWQFSLTQARKKLSRHYEKVHTKN